MFQMDTDRLKYFVVVAETGSLTKASQILGISHSGLSKAITALEIETKLSLFQPQGRGLEITSEGKWFYQKAKEILQIADSVLKSEKAKHNVIRIGISGVIAMTCSGFIVSELEMPASLFEIDVGEVEGKIVSGELDFGISFIPSPKPELEYLNIGKVTFNSYGREDLIKKRSGSELPFVVPASDYGFNPLGYKTRDGWPDGILRNPFFAVSSFAIALNILRAGQGVVYMPDFVAALENENSPSHKFAKVKDHHKAESNRQVYLVKSKSNAESKEMKKVSKIVRSVCCLRKT